jgi:hypothetical protein
LGATALALVGSPLIAGPAAAKVGVTSATDGDPLGKPPQESERVLRIGIDVQANELITTNAQDRAHLVFLDGSSLTVGPNAQLTIDRFVFDPNTKTGELAINASKGVLRLVGGKISKTTPITITTPSSTIGIRGGITILDVKAGQTDSTFVFGSSMTVRAAGLTQTATRPGSMIVTNFGSPPGLPTILAHGALNGQLGQLEGRRVGPGNAAAPTSTGGAGSAVNADQLARTSGFSNTNSSQPVRIIAPGTPDNFGSGPGPRARNPNETIVTAISNTNQSIQSTQAVQQLQQQQQQQQIDQQIAQQQAVILQPALPPPPAAVPVFNSGGGSSSTTVPSPDTPPNINLPQTGVATYIGPMFGTANNRLADGTYQNAWNFSTRSGNLTATFDGAQFQGRTVGTAQGFQTPNAISSSTAGQTNTSGSRSLSLSGNFFGSGSTPQYQAGSFNVTGRGYSGSGGFYGVSR